MLRATSFLCHRRPYGKSNPRGSGDPRRGNDQARGQLSPREFSVMPSSGRTDVEIRPVRSARDVEAFIAAAYTAQGHNPRWVPPLDFEFRQFFDRRHSVFMKENEVEAFVALRDGRPVGRIAAIINR